MSRVATNTNFATRGFQFISEVLCRFRVYFPELPHNYLVSILALRCKIIAADPFANDANYGVIYVWL